MRYALTIVAVLLASIASAQTPPDGAAVFEKACASCHAKPGPDSRAPTREVLRSVSPEAIVTALTVGNMFRQGSELTDAERLAVAGFLAGRPVGTAPPPSIVGRCNATPPSLQASALDAGWNGWGAGAANTRFQPAAKAGLTAANAPRLKLKWAFGFAGVNSARSQPAVLGGRLFVASDNGDVYALDAKRGCTYWTYHAQAGIRTAVSVGPYKSAGASGFAVFFSDGSATAYAVDTTTGKEIWRRKVDDHPYARATGSVTLYQNRLYVPIAGVGEEGQGGQPRYECCKFRGSVTALDASTGAVIWKSYTITEEPNRARRTRTACRRGARGRRRLGRAHGRPRSPLRLHHDRQQLLRSSDQYERRDRRDGHRDRQDSMVVSTDDQRRVDRRMPADESCRFELSRDTRPRSRLLDLAAVDKGTERPRRDHRAPEIRDGIRRRSR
jgi:polyvinyl alcohol dehydrogenase (cytochrome)